MHDFVVPKVGMGITEVDILAWKVSPGDTVHEGDPLVEIESDKTVIVLESDMSGVVRELLYLEEDIVEVGNVICRIEEDSIA